ncbi:MAG: hypothetical protein PUE67_03245 [Oscillospiraceae bacterium]|nr:hypothetical protein [Oscillospiraceae bacterium]
MKKFSTLFVCDVILALIIFARVNVKNTILSAITSTTSQADANAALTNSNWVVILTMVCVSVVIGFMVLSKTKNFKELILDIVFIGVVGVFLSVWWKVLAVTGWGYFCSYQEMMTYVGSFMIGACIVKVIMYLRKRAK